MINTKSKEKVIAICTQPFLRNFAKLVSGSFVAQFIVLLCAPILTRLYTPEDFGTLGFLTAISGFLALLGTLRFDLALMLPDKDSSAWKLFCLASGTSLLVSIIVLLLLLLFGDNISFLNGSNFYKQACLWLPIFVLSSSLLSLTQHWAIRCKAFGTISKATVTSSAVSNSCKIGAGLSGFGGWFLVFGALLQQLIQMGTLGLLLKKTIPTKEKNNERYYDLAKKYRNFTLWRMPQDVMASIAANLPNVLLAIYYSTQTVGFYLLAYRVTLAPLGLIKEAFQKVFYQKATELHHKGQCLYKSVRNMTLVLTLLCVPLFVFLFFFGESLFVVALGKEWLTAGSYSKYIGILVSGAVANTPSVVAMTVLEKNRELLIYELGATGLRVIAFIIAGNYLSAESTIAVFSSVSAVANCCLIFGVLIYLRKKNDIRKAS